MKTITIPTDRNPFTVRVNNKVYSFPAGATVTVEDTVAEVIAENIAARPKHDTNLPVYDQQVPHPTAANKVLKSVAKGDGYEWAEGEGGGGSGLPEFDENDDGKVLTVDEDELVWDDPPTGLPEITNDDDGKVLTVDGNEAKWIDPPAGIEYVDVSVDGQGVVTTNAVFADVAAAYAAGKQLVARAAVGGMLLETGTCIANPSTTPTVFAFFGTGDTSNPGAAAAPVLMKISFSATGAAAVMTQLAVAT